MSIECDELEAECKCGELDYLCECGELEAVWACGLGKVYDIYRVADVIFTRGKATSKVLISKRDHRVSMTRLRLCRLCHWLPHLFLLVQMISTYHKTSMCCNLFPQGFFTGFTPWSASEQTVRKSLLHAFIPLAYSTKTLWKSASTSPQSANKIFTGALVGLLLN